jgi:death-on-curing protein
MSTTISLDFVIAVHDEILRLTGVGRAGVDIERLASVLSRIEQQIHYNQINDIFEIAAWYAIVIAKGHAFVDGNKRTGLAVMLTYLDIQGCSIEDHTHLDDLMVAVVESQQPHEVIAVELADTVYSLSQ